VTVTVGINTYSNLAGRGTNSERLPAPPTTAKPC